MSDEIAAAVRELAELLRQRTELDAEVAKQLEEGAAQIPRPPVIDFEQLRAAEAREARARRELAERHRAEDAALRERLLAAVERRNELLDRGVGRIAP